MANLVDLLIGLGIDAEDYDRGFDAADQRSTSFIDRMTGSVGPAIVGAFAVGGAAVAGFALNAVDKFASFQNSMNEVFTLLPGISQDAMNDMSEQVKTFSKDFGVLPDKVVPALYQALSAGVPPDNVFAFLETANKAATAGVTDLEVAVDGISSVVNAYGSDIVNATQASDLMFTTVKLGKTNFAELSASIFNVTPAASAAGVAFGDVTAALAAITLQGVPTSVATTKLRSAINELSQSGTKTSDIFEKLTGKSFKDFVKGGGNLQGALQILEKHAKDTNVGINDLFGSVEAGSAALLLTGKGTDAFTTALAGMQNSAGATDAAFATMNQGITDAIDDMKASFAVFVLDVGGRLAPFAQFFADTLGKALPIVATAILSVIDPLTSFVNMLMTADDPIFEITNAIYPFSSILGDLVGFFLVVITEGDRMNDFFANLPLPVQIVVTAIMGLVDLLGNNLQPILLAIATVVGVVVVAAIASFIGGLIAVAAPILAVVAVIAALYAAWQSNFFGIRDIVTNVMTAVGAFISAALTTIQTFWTAHGTQIMAFITTTFNTIMTTIQDVLNIISIVVSAVFTFIAGFINTHGALIQQYLTNAWTVISNVIGAAVTLISGVIHAFLQILQGDWAGAWATIKTTCASFVTQIWAAIKAGFDNILIVVKVIWEAIKTAIATVLTNIGLGISTWFDTTMTFLRDLVPKAIEAAKTLGQGIIDGIILAIQDGIAGLAQAAQNAVMNAINSAKEALSIGSPSQVAADQIGAPISQGVAQGITRAAGGIVTALTGALGPVPAIVIAGVQVPINATLDQTHIDAGIRADNIGHSVVDKLEGQFGKIDKIAKTNIQDALSDALQKTDRKAFDLAGNIGESTVDGITSAIDAGIGAIKSAAREAAHAALDAAKDALGIGSPSKLAALQIGKPFAQGMIVGVRNMLQSVAQVGATAGQTLSNATSAAVPVFNGSATSASALGGATTNNGVTQNYNIDAHYTKYESERSLKDTIRMERLLNTPAGA